MRSHCGDAYSQAIRRGLGDGIHADIAACAGLVFNDHGTQRILDAFGHQAGRDIDRATRGIGHDDAHDLGLCQRQR